MILFNFCSVADDNISISVMLTSLTFVSVADDVYHPFQVANQRLTVEGSDRDVGHFELEDPSSVCHLYYNP